VLYHSTALLLYCSAIQLYCSTPLHLSTRALYHYISTSLPSTALLQQYYTPLHSTALLLYYSSTIPSYHSTIPAHYRPASLPSTTTTLPSHQYQLLSALLRDIIQASQRASRWLHYPRSVQISDRNWTACTFPKILVERIRLPVLTEDSDLPSFVIAEE
jgi:hypothetical protein